jgi:hypothetical protein
VAWLVYHSTKGGGARAYSNNSSNAKRIFKDVKQLSSRKTKGLYENKIVIIKMIIPLKVIFKNLDNILTKSRELLSSCMIKFFTESVQS